MKRGFDIFFGLLIFCLMLLPCFLIALLIKMTSMGPIIHWSKRVGRNNCIFMMPKFRSMIFTTPQLATNSLTNPERYLTPVGKFLRRTSLDELPQIYSVIIGDMSFVGPRPALYNQEKLIKERTKLGIHNLIPGITGYAQINGRDSIQTQDKVLLDYQYLKKQSFLFDLKIIFRTILKVIKSKDIAH